MAPSTATAVNEVLKSRWLGQGPLVDEFERRFSTLMLGRDAVAVGSCTDALHLAYMLAGIEPGDAVICPLFSCTATNIPLLWMGAKILFADVAPGSLNIDPTAIHDLMTENTKAIVVVHYGGAPVKMDSIWYTHGVPVIEDCAQALGGSYNQLPIGSVGHFSCFSFQAVKHVPTGDGGMLVLSSEIAEKARRIRWFGIDRKAKQNGTWANDITEVGYKYQMTDIAAAMGLAGLGSLNEQIEFRRSLVLEYKVGLMDVDGIKMIDTDADGAAWLCTILVEDRDNFRRKLAEHGIESDQVHYRNDRYSIFKAFRRPGEFPNMDAIESKYLCLPLHMGMGREDVRHISEVIRSGW